MKQSYFIVISQTYLKQDCHVNIVTDDNFIRYRRCRNFVSQ